jgi:hypothetical protein
MKKNRGEDCAQLKIKIVFKKIKQNQRIFQYALTENADAISIFYVFASNLCNTQVFLQSA